ncbi:MAG: TatD family hydrolase [Patescibacteria group bacterium]|jgi:TatD DNase family protein|nr:TatD family hydrolase [Patescibacteria group bacterium]
MIIDTHAHLNFEAFDDDWDEVIADCQAKGVWMINVGSQLTTSRKAVAMSSKYQQGVYAAVGLHPIHVSGSSFNPEAFNIDEYRVLLRHSDKIVALGETGIDFFHDDSNFENQIKVFVKHINLAKEFDRAVIVHSRNSKDGSRNAYEEILKIIKEQAFGRGVIHCFGGTVDQAKRFIDQGFFVGFTGIVTFDKTGELAEVIVNLPLESILIETDSPYLAPVPYRGKRNQPQYVDEVAKKIAEIKGIDYNKVVEQTVKNAQQLFKFN